MDFHIITARGAELVAQVVDGQLIVAPPPAKALASSAAAPAPPVLGT